MTIQERKLRLINQLSVIENKKLITEIEDLLKKTIIEEHDKSLKPMTEKELINKIKIAEEDIKAGRIYSQGEIEQFMKNKFKR